MNFPASDEEKMLVHEAVRELKQSLARSAKLAEHLVNILDDNFLALSHQYRKELFPSVDQICAALWKINVCFIKTLTQKERIIKSENKTE